MLGGSRYPFPQTTDFSAFLLQAQASKAKVLGLAMAGDDLVNCVKQAQEFGLTKSGMKSPPSAVHHRRHALGLETMQGMIVPRAFWWDLDDRTRGFTKRVRAAAGGRLPELRPCRQLRRRRCTT